MHCPECSLKIEPETILCPHCSVKGAAEADADQVCDIFLMGFSDPSTYGELISYLLQRSFWDSREDILARLSNLPVLVTKGVVAGKAHRLRDELENLGGIVELRDRQMRDRGTAKKIIAQDEEEAEELPPPGAPSRGGKGYLILFLLSMVAVVYLAYYHDFSQDRKRVQKAVQKITSHFPSSTPKKEIEKSKVGAAEKVSLTEDLDPEGARLNNEGVAHMDKGRYDEAIQSFQAALQLIPGEGTILQNLHRAWIQLGYRRLENGEYEKSIRAFEEAVRVSDQSPEVYKLMGISAMELTDVISAEEYFRKYLARVPDDPEIARILGEIYYKQNRLEEGIQLLKVYLSINPDDRRVQDLVNKAGREMSVEQGFDTHEGANFDVRYDGQENLEAGYLVVGILDEIFQRIGAELNYYPTERLVAILYSDEDFRVLTQTPDWTRGLYDGKIRIPIGGLKEKSETLERVISHEYTHAIIHQMAGGRAPTWLNEGLAQYFEGEPGEMHVRNVDYILRTQDSIPLRNLEGSFLNMDAGTAAIAYTESFTLVDMIIQEHGIYAIQKLLSELADGSDVESALQISVGSDYASLQEEWMRYLTQ
jgi:tetratricopeptide (TPR) repeat protein